VEVDVDPDAGGDPVGAAMRRNVTLAERGFEVIALLTG
jgi:hypothetical protein